MKSLFVKLSLVFLVFTFCISCATEDDEAIFTSKKEVQVTYSTIENEILNLVNEYRKEKHLSILNKLNIISSVAETHTNYMVEIGEVNHDNFPERHKNLVNNAQAISVGENVAYGYSTAESVVNAWLNSDGHREIIENESFTHFGISTQKDENGRNYFTHIFINK